MNLVGCEIEKIEFYHQPTTSICEWDSDAPLTSLGILLKAEAELSRFVCRWFIFRVLGDKPREHARYQCEELTQAHII